MIRRLLEEILVDYVHLSSAMVNLSPEVLTMYCGENSSTHNSDYRSSNRSNPIDPFMKGNSNFLLSSNHHENIL